MFELLMSKRPSPETPEPMPVLAAQSWRHTSDLAKRMCLRDHVYWAATHGCLQDVHALLKALTEEEWHHIGG